MLTAEARGLRSRALSSESEKHGCAGIAYRRRGLWPRSAPGAEGGWDRRQPSSGQSPPWWVRRLRVSASQASRPGPRGGVARGADGGATVLCSPQT